MDNLVFLDHTVSGYYRKWWAPTENQTTLCPNYTTSPDLPNRPNQMLKPGQPFFTSFQTARAQACMPRQPELRRSMEREIIGIWGTFRQSSCSSPIPIMRIFWAWESSVVLRWVALIMYTVHIYVMYLPLLKRPVLEVSGMTKIIADYQNVG